MTNITIMHKEDSVLQTRLYVSNRPSRGRSQEERSITTAEEERHGTRNGEDGSGIGWKFLYPKGIGEPRANLSVAVHSLSRHDFRSV